MSMVWLRLFIVCSTHKTNAAFPAHCQKAHYDKHYEKDNWKEIIIYNTSTATTAVGGYHLDYPIAYIYIHMYHSMLAC